MNDPSLVLLEEFPSSFAANVAKGFLESQGIETFIFDQFTQNMALGTGSFYVRLMIGADDLDAARTLLAKQNRSGSND